MPSISLPAAAAVAGMAGAGVSAYGSIESANAQGSMARYQAQVAQMNAQASQQKAQQTMAAGEAKAGQQELATRARVGGIVASQGANNIDVNSGSALQVRESQGMLGQVNTADTMANAANQAFGYMTEGTTEQAEAGLENAQASQASTAGAISAAGSLLGGASSVGSRYASWQLQATNPNSPNAILMGYD